MCGIPYHAAFTYIKKILSASKSVAICNQVEEASLSKGIVKREVVRVITPGTIIEDVLLKDDSNNFLASVFHKKNDYGIVFVDISTGDFIGCNADNIIHLEAELSRLPVKEIVISSDDEETRTFLKRKFSSISVSNIDSWYWTASKSQKSIKEYFNIETLKGWELDEFPEIASACGGIIEYLKETQKGEKLRLKNFRIIRQNEYMLLDRNTQTNLELIWNQQDFTKKNTLLEVLDFTKSAMGRRKLIQYILNPLKDAELIRKRLNSVEYLINNPEISEKLTQFLSDISDMERIIMKTSFGSANARDLYALKESLKILPSVQNILNQAESALLKEIASSIIILDDIVIKLEKSIVDSPPLTVKDGNIIKKGYSKELDELIEIASGDRKWITSLEENEKKRLNIPTLKVGYNKIYGYYIEITKTHSDKIPAEYNRKQTLINSERYITEELKRREDAILGAAQKKCELEYKIFTELRKAVILKTAEIQKNASLIARLDVLNSFSIAAKKHSYVKPHIDDENDIIIKDGRHPTVEINMGLNEFIPNDTNLDGDENQIMIITGPNMSGKSTYLKQTAIIVIMAQLGSFVPASYAKIGIIDRVFTRVGSGENLAGGESTFMVEMTEVAAILAGATSKSILIMDEVGRGTSTFDGVSIAWAVIEKIAERGARTLFATHYFELTQLASYLNKVKNYNFAVREWKDKKKIVFLRKLKNGSADKSYGIHCAELAGVEGSVIKRAWQIFKKLEKDEFNTFQKPGVEQQLTFFESESVENDKYLKKIKKLNLNNIAPLEVVNIIKNWQEEINEN